MFEYLHSYDYRFRAILPDKIIVSSNNVGTSLLVTINQFPRRGIKLDGNSLQLKSMRSKKLLDPTKYSSSLGIKVQYLNQLYRYQAAAAA